MAGSGDDNIHEGPPPRPSPPRRPRESIVIEGQTAHANARRVTLASPAFKISAPLMLGAVGGALLTGALVYATRPDYGALAARVEALEVLARAGEALDPRVVGLENAAKTQASGARTLDERLKTAETLLAAAPPDAALKLGRRLDALEQAAASQRRDFADGLSRAAVAAEGLDAVKSSFAGLKDALSRLPDRQVTQALAQKIAALEARPSAEGLDAVKTGLVGLKDALSRLPDRQMTEALAQKIAALEARPTAEGLDALTTSLAGLKDVLSRLPDRQVTEALAQKIAALEAERAAVDSRLAPLAAELARVNRAGGAQRGEFEALRGRLAKAETALFAPKSETRAARAGAAALSDAPPTARALAALALRDRLAAGEPLRDELAALDRLGVEPAALAPLRVYAERGAPSLFQLSRAFGELAPSLAPASTGLWDWAQGLVQVRKLGESRQTDGAGGVPQVEAALARGDLAAALSVMPAPPPAARDAARAWMDKVAARLAATKAAAELAQRSLADLGAR